MQIEIDDLSRPQVHALLEEHLANMHANTPADRVFALDLSRLRTPDITVWTAWESGELLGIGALRELDRTHGEIKSMRTPERARGRGAAKAVLARIIETARARGYERLSLETGTHPDFMPAQSLYRSFGFEPSGPFGSYEADPHSAFMALRLTL